MGVVEGDDENAPYLPTPEEIAAACQAIQTTWSAGERLKRQSRRPKLIPTDPERVRREAMAKLETRLTKHERPVVIEETSRRGDAVPLEMEPLPMECF